MLDTYEWIIPGADDQPIIGTTHVPDDPPRGIVLLCHGFKGYKDYGFFPQLAEAAGGAGLTAHRFNFSHSGMTRKIETFERPDLFEADTWGKQFFDLQCVSTAARTGALSRSRGDQGQLNQLPMTWFGHSRGGVTVILTAAIQGETNPDRVIAAATPSQACFLDAQQCQQLRKTGFIESPSARTGQVLRIGRTWLDEIEAEPDTFDPVRAIAQMQCPLLLIHGDGDETVPVAASQQLERAATGGAKLRVLPGASHTFDAPNPLGLDQTPPAQTKAMIDAVVEFAVG